MIGRIEPILQHEPVSAAAGVLNQNQYSATTWGSDRSHIIPWEGEQFLLIVMLDAVPTGTTPTFTVAVQVSEDGGAFAAPIGGAMTTAALATAVPAVVVSPAAGGVGFMTDYLPAQTHRYNLRVLVTAAAADNAVTGMSIHLAFLY